MSGETYGLWKGLREYPWDEDQVPRPATPHPAPAVRGIVGNWLEEFQITTWPAAPAGWRLTQFYAEGHGIHASLGTPTQLTRSLVLSYFHRTEARGVTVTLHYKAGTRKDGSGSWLPAEDFGLTWRACTDLDCEYDEPHLAEIPKTAGPEELKALLTEGDPDVYSVTTTYRPVNVSAKRKGRCPGCGKPTERSRTFTMTISPFNKNPDDSIRTPREVRGACAAEAAEWAPEPEAFRHQKCT